MKNSERKSLSNLRIFYPKDQIPSEDKKLEIGSYRFAYKFGEYASSLPK